MIRIPDNLKGCFWDIDAESTDLEECRDFAVARLFTKGGREGISFALKTFTDEEIKHAARVRRDLNPIVANWLSSYYGVPKDEMIYYKLGLDKNPLWRN